MEMTSFLNGLKKMYIVYLKICVIIVIMFNVHVKSILQKMRLDKQFRAHSIDERNNQYARSKVEKNNLSSSVTLYPTVPTSSLPSTSPVPRSASEYKSSHLASSDSQTFFFSVIFTLKFFFFYAQSE